MKQGLFHLRAENKNQKKQKCYQILVERTWALQVTNLRVHGQFFHLIDDSRAEAMAAVYITVRNSQMI